MENLLDSPAMIVLAFIVLPILVAHLIAKMAVSRGRSYWPYFLFACFFPVISWIVVFMMKPLDANE